ncbi:MAG: hypothetical protein E7376_03780 [Clostridiales bacterium]|nr:hypothetical protein [Clostridiales bacterium]
MSKVLAKKLESMPIEKQREFLEKLTNKLKILSAELKDIEASDKKLSIRETKRELTNSQAQAICISIILGCAAVGGVITGFIEPFAIPLGALVGALCSIPVMFVTALFVDNKLISNMFAKIKQVINNKKQIKVNKEKDLLDKMIAQTEENIKKDIAFERAN